VKRIIHWFRRDLRVSDNTALSEAARRAEQVIPVFLFEDTFCTGADAGSPRILFLPQSLEALRKNLAELGYPLIIRSGESPEVLAQLSQEVGAEAVFANKRYEPHAEARDSRIFNALNAAGIGFELFKDSVVWEEQEILTQAGKPFTVFTPYSRAWKTRTIPTTRPRLRQGRSPKSQIRSDPLPADASEPGHAMTRSATPAGERAALERLQWFMARPVYGYATSRNFPAVDGTSQLSPHLRCGTIGIRTILAALTTAREAATTPAQRQSCEAFLNELIWREFYLQILHSFPHVTTGAFRLSTTSWPGWTTGSTSRLGAPA
jgi:deoxyribodipyrimidine photo-lyase